MAVAISNKEALYISNKLLCNGAQAPFRICITPESVLTLNVVSEGEAPREATVGCQITSMLWNWAQYHSARLE